MEGGKRAWDLLNLSATKTLSGRRSPRQVFSGEVGPFQVLPFLQPG